MPDFVDVTRTARLLNKTQFLDALKEGRFSKGMVPTDAQIRFYGSTAVATYQEGPGPNSGGQARINHIHTHVWVNMDGKGWRLASLHLRS